MASLRRAGTQAGGGGRGAAGGARPVRSDFWSEGCGPRSGVRGWNCEMVPDI